jgi:hypothetical protein
MATPLEKAWFAFRNTALKVGGAGVAVLWGKHICPVAKATNTKDDRKQRTGLRIAPQNQLDERLSFTKLRVAMRFGQEKSARPNLHRHSHTNI